MDQQRLDAIRARCEAATRGPWDTPYTATVFGDGLVVAFVMNTQNRDFIAHARTDVPDMLAEIERLTAENRKVLDEYNDLSRDYHACASERDTLRQRCDMLENDLINANMNLEHTAEDNARLRADLAAMTAERDVMRERAEAAERDLRAYLDRILHSAPGTYGPYACHLCKHSDIHNTSCRVKTKCDGISRWEWRGPVDGKEVPQ